MIAGLLAFASIFIEVLAANRTKSLAIVHAEVSKLVTDDQKLADVVRRVDGVLPFDVVDIYGVLKTVAYVNSSSWICGNINGRTLSGGRSGRGKPAYFCTVAVKDFV